jgi:hypothetical protein
VPCVPLQASHDAHTIKIDALEDRLVSTELRGANDLAATVGGWVGLQPRRQQHIKGAQWPARRKHGRRGGRWVLSRAPCRDNSSRCPQCLFQLHVALHVSDCGRMQPVGMAPGHNLCLHAECAFVVFLQCRSSA